MCWLVCVSSMVQRKAKRYFTVASLKREVRSGTDDALMKPEVAVAIARVKVDFFEFLKYVKIREPDELSAEYILWPHLIDFYKQLQAHKLIYLVKAKQIGISWALAILALWEIYTKEGWVVLEISKGEKEAQELLEKSKIVYNNLPEWMRVWTLEPNSTERFGFKELGSEIVALPSTITAGIGRTAGRVIHDEADFHELFEVNLSHTKATVADSPGRKLVSVSTVDTTKTDSYFTTQFKYGNNSGYPEAGQNGFESLFYGVHSRPDRDEAWYEQLVRENRETPWVVQKNYPRTIKEALSPLVAQSCFNSEVLEKLWDDAVEPEVRQGFIFILSKPIVGVKYVAGVDVGEGVGLDYSSLTIIGQRGLKSEVVAKIYINTLATDLFAYEIVTLCRDYFNCFLGIENNSLGVAVTNKVVELGYTNLFSSEAEEKKKRHLEVTGKEKVGWTTGEKNKQTALVELVQAVDNSSLTTGFKPQIKEMMEWQWIKGKPMPTGKTHGDTVISLMIANQMLKYVRVHRPATFYVGGVQVR